ncbi:Tbingi protein [Trypanosoma theileri]|uniref:Tbingi protein n=1 Tax=Trypanosoma theileri TaxID=67003 RepID=A0A1X0P332_9TRYP|nr:Tbingi protein [Trypanosoma theileri]ORC91295.1 Tbingi protein [Trypanosoma theileri]
MEVNVDKTKYTLFGTSDPNPLFLELRGITVGPEKAPKLLGITFQNYRGMSTHVVQTRKRMDFRLLQLAAISSTTWGPKRDVLRAFYLTLIQAQTLYGFEIWYWDAAPTSRKLLAGQNKACRTIARIPYGCRSADALREARLLPLEMMAMIRSLKYLMRCQIRGGSLRESAEQVYHETHPVREFYVRIMKIYPTLVIEPRESPLLTPTLRFGKRARFFTSLENVSADDPEERKRGASERWIARHFRRKGTEPPPRTHYEIWTDGSVFLGVKS